MAIKAMARRLILGGVACIAAAVSTEAAERRVDFSAGAFKDLPGVEAAPLSPEPRYQCRLVTRQTDRWGDIDFIGRSGMPQLVYHCEKDGQVFESTRPPLSWEWAPGINPLELPR